MELESSERPHPLLGFSPTIEKRQVLHIATGDMPLTQASSKQFASLCFQFEIFYRRPVHAPSMTNEQDFNWAITRSYKEFSSLSSELYRESWYREMPKLPGLPSARELRRLDPADQLQRLHEYLTTLTSAREFCESPSFWEFLEVSIHSFEKVEMKYKEGYVYKRTGGKTINETRCLMCSKYFKRLQKRWLMVRPNAIGYVTNNQQRHWHEALMFKNKFHILSGLDKTGFDDGIVIDTSRRKFMFRTGSVASRIEWVEAIQTAYDNSEWNTAKNRYESSFPIRDNCLAVAYVDGEDYFAAVYKKLKKAQHHVFISDWWLSPELFLLRPASSYPESQILEVLRTLAERNVNIYIHVYKEVALALTLNSRHTIHTLQQLHPNIRVVRHPHRSLAGGEFIWSHHEKLIVIDYKVAFLGGLDLCYGRMDTNAHRLFDNGPVPYWNGIDYSNSRIADFTNVQNWQRDSIDRNSLPRMPWHDVAMRVKGKAAADVAMHFIELWNHVMTDMAGDYYKAKQVLEFRSHPEKAEQALVPVFSEAPKKAVVAFELQIESPRTHLTPLFEVKEEASNPFEVSFDQMIAQRQLRGRSKSLNTSPKRAIIRRSSIVQAKSSGLHRFDVSRLGKMMVTRSSDDPSVLLPITRANLTVQKNAREMQRNHTIVAFTDASPGATLSTEVFAPNRPRLHTEVLSYSQDNEGEEDEERKAIKKEMENDTDNLTTNLLKSEDKPRLLGNCDCQLLRSSSLWSIGLEETEHSIHTAYLHMIEEADHFIYIENQFFISGTAGEPVSNQIAKALVERIKVAADNQEAFRVIVVLPLLPAFEGAVDDPSATVLRIQLHWEYMTICRGVDSIFSQLREHESITDPAQYIKFFGLRTHGVLNGTPHTEIVYVHSKLMIIDDKTVIMGSANINDRSMSGSSDSEIAMVIEDQDLIETLLGGAEVLGSKFAYDLRIKLFKEFSGCDNEWALKDPLDEAFVEVWDKVAEVRRMQRNTQAYRAVFNCYPDDKFRRISDLVKAQTSLDDYATNVDSIKGFLVDFPLEFLADEDLKITIFSKEYYIPDITFV
jgi:phospholipase D1/2